MLKDRNRARAVHRRIKNPATRQEHKRLIAIARKVLRGKKRANFHRFAGTLNRFIDVGYVWKKRNVFKNHDNKQTWGRENDDEYKSIVRGEMDR